MKIVILDSHTANPGDLSWSAFQEVGEVAIYDRTKPSELIERCIDAECILTNKVVIDECAMSKLPKLKYIGVLATGYNVVDVECAKERGIVVTNIPAYSTHSVVQMTFAHILNITNRIEHYAVENRNGRWAESEDFCYWDMPMHELCYKTIGIIGLGNIGMNVALVAKAFGMNVLAYTSKQQSELPEGILKTTFEELLRQSDVVSLHCPLTEKTKGLINISTVEMMKQGAILVNTGRGPLVKEADLAMALKSGRIAAYGADVLCEEPPSKSNPLLSAPNAFITPHIAWATVESRTRLISTALNNVKAFANGTPVNTV